MPRVAAAALLYEKMTGDADYDDYLARLDCRLI